MRTVTEHSAVRTLDAGSTRYRESFRAQSIPARVTLLANILPPYLLPVFRKLAGGVRDLRILLSVPMEEDRPWAATWDGLDVKVQKSISVRHRQKHPQGFVSEVPRHFSYDTMKLLSNYQPDVIITTQLGFRTIQSIAHRFRFRRSRLVIWVDGSEHTERAFGSVQTLARRMLLRCADAVLVIGQSGERYVRRLGVPASRIVQVPFVTDMAPLLAIPLDRNEESNKCLLYVGRLIECKGLISFVRELGTWLQRHPTETREMCFIGEGPVRTGLDRINIPANLKLKFLGNVPYGDVSAYYARASICVLPTLADTWGLVVNEALAAGAPVLGSLYSQAVEQLVRDGENGWTYYPDKPGDAQRALARAFSTGPDDLARMRRNARASVAHLTPEYAADRFLRVIALAQSAREETSRKEKVPSTVSGR